MADKEATVYIVDCGRSMGETSHGRSQSNLDWALEYVWDKITTTIASGRKTFLAGAVGLRTDGTLNELSDDPDYAHISVFKDLGQVLMPDLRKLRDRMVVSETDAGDAISALVIAIQMIVNTCKKLKYTRKIVLVTDARAPMQTDDLSDITQKLKEDSIELLVLGVDFDDPEYGFKEEDKNTSKAENEAVLKTLCNDCGGTFGTIAQAIDELGVPRVKSTRPIASYKGLLTLGNPEEYETALSIAIERYPKTMEARPPASSKFVTRGDIAGASQLPESTSAALQDGESDGLAAVKNARTYQVVDEEAPGGKKDVEYDELSKGYEYGRTAVHISEADRNVTTYETTAGMDIIGFVDKNQYARYLGLGRTFIIVSAKHDDKGSMALSSLIHALYELESYAIARLVSKENKEPRILVLAPNIEPDFECLYDNELPFAEDVRSYKFPPLDRVVTVSGKVITVHRNLPTVELQDAMSAYVDSMDLSTYEKDDEGNDTEYAPMEDTYSPMLHRINQVVKHRAIYPDAAPPEPNEILTRYATPPADLVKQSSKSLERLIAAADVKKVPPKARGKRYGRGKGGREAEKPLSELDIGKLLAQDPARKTKRIDPNNAIPEFKQLLYESEKDEDLPDACKQLKNIIFGLIKHSVGDSGYGRAEEGLRVMREQIGDEFEAPQLFNDVLRELKAKLLAGELGGDRKEMWYRIRRDRLGLIHKGQSAFSDVGEEDAKAFMSAK